MFCLQAGLYRYNNNNTVYMRGRFRHTRCLAWRIHCVSHCDRVTHICVSKLDHHWLIWWLSPVRSQAIIGTNAGIVNWILGIKYQLNLNQTIIFIQGHEFQNIVCKMQPFCIGLNVVNIACACRQLAYSMVVINKLRPRQNGRHFADDTFKRIFQWKC